MNYKVLGKTGLKVSEIGFGGEWLERHPEEESIELMKYASEKGINIIDCWMPDPKSRDIIGKAMKGNREKWYVQGHFGSTWQNGQYVRTRDMKAVKPAFEDLLTRLQTDYIDIGMIHYVDTVEDWNSLQDSDFLKYVLEMKEKGINIAIGTDGCASNNTLNMFREMGLLSLIHKGIAKDSTALPSEYVVKAATLNAAKALHMEDKLGVIKEGALADIIFLDLLTPSMFPANNIVSSLCYSANGSEVNSVMINGDFVMKDRILLTIDTERMYNEVEKIVEKYL